MSEKLVCVTGASGFIASHLVKVLLDRGYRVRATVRDKNNTEKNKHLTSLPGANERLHLYSADLLHDGVFDEVVDGVECVFHTASPFFINYSTNAEKELLEPAEKGTSNVLNSVNRAASVKRVVLTSSMASVLYNFGKRPADHVYTEQDWSDDKAMREKASWYPLSKTLAERKAWEVASQQNRWSLVVINPTLVVGPLLQKSLNTSSEIILDYLNGKKQKISTGSLGLVDVRDVALAHVLAFENPQASGRYVTMTAALPWVDIVAELRKVAREPQRIPTEVDEGPISSPTLFDNSKLVSLLGSLHSVSEMLKDTVESLYENGFIQQL